jgi:transcriptional regulator with PAS, ATPase and Fis domain
MDFVEPFTPGQGTNVVPETPTATIRVHAVQLEVTSGPDAGATARVEQPTFTIGTGESAHLRLSDNTVSREHLRISLQPDGVLLRDPGSTNGTWMGTMRVESITIATDVVLTLGSTTIALRVEAAPLDLPVSTSARFGNALGESNAMRHLFAVLERAARSEATVLLEGESGVGKEILAQAIHAASPRAQGPFVPVDCGAIPPTLIESELFGHERGAFTGADRARVGAFEQANGGTLFLDEIGELPLEMQPKLLRVLETREVRPLGARGTRPLDVRIVAATNRNLGDASRKGDFRLDLFYRLAVVRAMVPPLRDRREDIMPLARAFLRRIPGFEATDIPPDLAGMLTSYTWPGNVRELRNVMDRYAVFGPNPGALFDANVPNAGGIRTAPADDLSHLPYHEARRVALDRFERSYLPAVLARAGNVVVRAAQLAEVGRGSFHRMLRRVRAPGTDDEG